MRLHWKFILIINVATVIALGCFSVYDYYLARRDMDAAYLENFYIGINMTKVVELIKQQMAKLYGARDVPFEVEAHKWLKSLREEHPVEMADVLDVYVTDYMGVYFSDLEAPVLVSLTGKEEEIEGDLIVAIDEATYDVIKTGAMYVGGISQREYGQRASTVIVWYLKLQNYLVAPGDEFIPEDLYALVQVVFSTEKAWSLLNMWRMKHLLYVFVTSLILQLFIVSFAMIRMVSRPLQQIITAIERAEEGDLEIHNSVSYTDTGMDRLLLSLYRMLSQIRVAQRERIAELGTLAAGLAHEVRNPLNIIAMTAEYLRRRLSEPRLEPEVIIEVQESLETVIEEVDAINEITRRFIDLTRPLVLESEPTDINELLESALAGMSVALQEASVHVIHHYEASKEVPVDPAKLRQAFINLIQNAIQAMAPRGGRLYITTAIRQGITGERVIIEIRDTGPGMPPHVLDHIFEAYYTTRETEGGLGLGLTITRQIVQAHDGQIEVRSQEGMGTAFIISLPCQSTNEQMDE